MFRTFSLGLLLLSVAACELTDAQRDQVADIAGDVAADPDEVAKLQTEIESLRHEVRALQSEVARLSRNDETDTENLKRIYEAHNNLLNAYKEHHH